MWEAKNLYITILFYFRKFYCLHLKYYLKKCNPKLVTDLKHSYILQGLFKKYDKNLNSICNCLSYSDKKIYLFSFKSYKNLTIKRS